MFLWVHDIYRSRYQLVHWKSADQIPAAHWTLYPKWGAICYVNRPPDVGDRSYLKMYYREGVAGQKGCAISDTVINLGARVKTGQFRVIDYWCGWFMGLHFYSGRNRARFMNYDCKFILVMVKIPFTLC